MANDTVQIEQQILSTLVVKNIFDGTTNDEIVTFFGLAATPFLQENTKVECLSGTTARIIVPQPVADEMLKLDGHVFKGQSLSISLEEDELPRNDNVNNDEGIDLNDISHMEIATRRPEWSCNNVKRVEIVRALEMDHREDFTKSVEPLRNHLLGLFRIDSDDYSRYLNRSITVRGIHRDREVNLEC